MNNLYKHQVDFISSNPNKSALVWSCGTGKSRTAIEWARLGGSPPLVICPKSLKLNWKREMDKWGCEGKIVSKEEFRKDYKSYGYYKQVIVDECFPAGTKVLTPLGYKNIEDIKTNDKVISAIGEDIVNNITQKVADTFIKIIFNKTEIIVTPEHPIFTTRGWVKANKLTIQDVLLHYGFINDILLLYEKDIQMQKVQKDSPIINLFGISQRQKKVLPSNISTKEFLQLQLSDEVSLEAKQKIFNEVSSFSKDKPKTFRTNEKKEPYEEPSLERKSTPNIITNGASTNDTWRKWTSHTYASENFTGGSWERVVRRTCNPYSVKKWLSNLLQNRHRQSCIKNCYRSRWFKSRHSFGKGKRQKENEVFTGYRVESVEVQERKNTPVFNLGVKGHPSYVINDILVHNCHNGFLTPHFKSQMSKALRDYIKKNQIPRILLLSATVYTSSPWNIYQLGTLLGHKWDWIKFKYTFFNEIRMGRRMIPVAKKGCEVALAKITKKIASVVNIYDVLDVPLQNHLEPEYFTLTNRQKNMIKEAYDPLPIVRFTAQHIIEQKGDKSDRIYSLCEENPKIAIVCRYKGQIDALYNLLKSFKPLVISGDVKDRDSVCREAENADKAVVIIQADCGLGFELPSFPLCVYVSMSYSYTSWEQMNGRFLRVNRPSRTTFMYLLTEGKSIDQAVYDAIKRKEDFKIELFK